MRLASGTPGALTAQDAVRRAGWVALAAAVLTAGLITYGGWVRASGSGLGCPDWPLCNGGLLPDLEGTTAIEFGHRAFAGITMLVAGGAALLAFYVRRTDSLTALLLVGAFGAILVQAGLGGVTVLTELAGWAVTAHLSLAMATLALLTSGAVRALRPRLGIGPGVRFAALLLVLGAMMIIMGSTLVGTGYTAACPGVPLCDGRTAFTPSLVHAAHRLASLAFGLLVLVVVYQLHRHRRSLAFKGLMHTVLLLTGGQMAVGLLSVWNLFPQGLQVLHLGLATLIWWGVVAFWSLAVAARRA